jgi:DNA adenine methylase
MKTWKKMRRTAQQSFTSRRIAQFATAALFLNRTNYSGILSAGPIGGALQTSDYGLSCRFNRAAISRQIQTLSMLQNAVEVTRVDGLSLIKRSTQRKADEFLYLDPPYYKNGAKFYRRFFNDRQHSRLKNLLGLCNKPWLLSYDFEDHIADLYKDDSQILIALYHSAKVARSKHELLISNQGLNFLADRRVAERLPSRKKVRELVSA